VKVVFALKDGRMSKNFPVLEWLDNLCSHIQNRHGLMVRAVDSEALLDAAVEVVIPTCNYKVINLDL
jgi:hypothetical protein